MQTNTRSVPETLEMTGWQQQIQGAIRDPSELCDLLDLPGRFRESAVRAAADFPVFAPVSYVRQMKQGDPKDPLLRQVLPLGEELQSVDSFSLDPVGDSVTRRKPGMIQKYRGRALLITSGLCAIHCRYCFRRHYPYGIEPKSLDQWKPAIAEVQRDATIHEIIFSGGDPLSLSDSRLGELLRAFDQIRHVRRLRIHTRLPVVIPDRVTEQLLARLSPLQSSWYVVLHVNHANELSREVLEKINSLRRAGAMLLNQSVLLRGVNDSVNALYQLCEKLSDHGVMPYYLNQLDRVAGAAHFEVPVSEGKRLVSELRQQLPGYAVPRYVREIAGEPNKVVLA